MKNLELTKEHRSKLLEMCKYLFINYSDIIFSTDYDQFEDTTEEDNPNILIFYQGSGKSGIAIHWFEFCMTHLVEKLSELINNWEEIPQYVSNVYPNSKGKWNLYTKFHFHYPKACKGGSKLPINPIDYLYEEFKIFYTKM